VLERVAEALLVEFQQARARHPQVLARLARRIDLGGVEVAAVDQMMDRLAGDRKQCGNIADFDEGRDRLFLG
jgi:ribosomal 50S subunit-associated protein YjgA (DUF615 family)